GHRPGPRRRGADGAAHRMGRVPRPRPRPRRLARRGAADDRRPQRAGPAAVAGRRLGDPLAGPRPRPRRTGEPGRTGRIGTGCSGTGRRGTGRWGAGRPGGAGRAGDPEEAPAGLTSAARPVRSTGYAVRSSRRTSGPLLPGRAGRRLRPWTGRPGRGAAAPWLRPGPAPRRTP